MDLAMPALLGALVGFGGVTWWLARAVAHADPWERWWIAPEVIRRLLSV